MRTITYYPLWIAILFWSLWSDLRTKYDPNSIFWLSERLSLLELLRGSLPVPHNWFKRKATSIVLNWIDTEVRKTTRMAYGLTALNG
ncbi:MAG: hypothetical protein A2X80_09980 [Geobacteraceae bacterium GWB2_52_12]|nr:MAG: hypothetical protein A2X80_09980 [Geobacteraceae bacterium GWB2_52_12]